MELRTIRYFVTIAQRLSFAGSAAELKVTQSALTRQMQGLERELNLKLFDRVGRGVILTPAGQDLLHRARDLLNDANALREQARLLSAGSTGTLTVGATPQTLESFVSRLLGGFRALCPEVEVRFVEAGASRLVQEVKFGNVDVAIAPQSGDMAVDGRPLFPLGALAVLPPNHRLRGCAFADVNELANEPVLLLRAEFMTRQIFDGACQLARVSPRIMIESASPQCILALAREGHGIAIVPSTLHFTPDREEVARLTHGGRQLGTWLSIVWNSRRTLSPATHVFVDEVCRVTYANYPGRQFAASTDFPQAVTARETRSR